MDLAWKGRSTGGVARIWRHGGGGWSAGVVWYSQRHGVAEAAGERVRDSPVARSSDVRPVGKYRAVHALRACTCHNPPPSGRPASISQLTRGESPRTGMRPLTNLSKFSAVGTSSWGRRTGTPFQSPRGLVQRRKQGEQVVEERVRELADAVVLATAALRRRGIILRLLHSVEQVAYHSGRGRSACAGARRGKERLSDGGDQEDGWRKRVESKRGI